MVDETQQRIDEAFMQKALFEAQKAAEAGEVPIGAVVVCRGKIISRAHNLTETLHDVTAHAEMQAITAAALHGMRASHGWVEPCSMCAAALGWAQMGRIVYGTPDEKRGYRLYAPRVLHPKATVTQGVLAEACRQLMQQFFQQRR